MILFLRADSPDVVVELIQNGLVVATKQWQAGRELSLQLNTVIDELCEQAKILLSDLSGIVVYEGPGSYTGLRISISVANALGYSYDVPIVGSSGENWRKIGLESLTSITKFSPIAPIYGGEVFTTKPKK